MSNRPYRTLMQGNRKVKHGTPIHSNPSLCDTCRLAQKTQGMAESEGFVHCQNLGKNITFKVSECSAYDDKRIPSLYDMRQQAWRIATDKSGKQVGFMSPGEFRKRVNKGEDLREAGQPMAPELDY